MKLLTVVGARPQFVKAATVSRAIEARNALRCGGELITEVLVHTGQHYDKSMSGVFFDELGLPGPQYTLDVGSGSHGFQTGLMLIRLEEVLVKERPDRVLTYGDTNSTLAGALAGAKLRMPVSHVEAGLRSFNRGMAEETNRIVTDHLSDQLFCPTLTAVGNLANEGIVEGVHLVGDVMCDSVMHFAEVAAQKELDTAAPIGDYCIATIHRAENTDDPCRLHGILEGLAGVGSAGLAVIVPLHPRTRARLIEFGLVGNAARLSLRPPASYLEMLRLTRRARLVLTDSGGLQKEAYLLGVPCVTLRDETEWIETIESGWNALAGTEPDRIIAAARMALARSPSERLPLYGDGLAAARIIDILANPRNATRG